MKSNLHVKRVFGLLIIAGIAGFGIQQLLLPDTFGTIGHYRAESLKVINRYQVEFAPKLKQEGLDLFGGRFQASRRILGPVE